ncbi:MAG: GDP-mannose 4,6-dehydratase [Acidimicrobiia bacterium]|nr:GDP-mannose 4,6-dehydratase [Acidimicrobiia bacterium]
MITRAVVTGGAGFIGANLVERIADEGADVLVVDDLSSGRLVRLIDARATGNVNFHQADIRQPEIVDLLAKFAPEVVFHLAAQIDARRSVVEPVVDASINVVGTVNVVQAAVEAGASRVVFASSGGAQFGTTDTLPTPETEPRRPESPYGVAKAVVDRYLEYYAAAHGLEYVSLGFANVYGPGQDPHGEAGVVAIFVQTLLRARPAKIYGDGSITRDYVYVDDVVDACIRAAQRGAGHYLNIGTGMETSVNRLYDMVAKAVGSPLRPEYLAAKPGDVPRSCLDASLAKEVLGWEPWMTLEEGIDRTVQWFRRHPDF